MPGLGLNASCPRRWRTSPAAPCRGARWRLSRRSAKCTALVRRCWTRYGIRAVRMRVSCASQHLMLISVLVAALLPRLSVAPHCGCWRGQQAPSAPPMDMQLQRQRSTKARHAPRVCVRRYILCAVSRTPRTGFSSLIAQENDHGACEPCQSFFAFAAQACAEYQDLRKLGLF